MDALFRRYPALQGRLPYVRLAELPTPLVAAPALADAIGAGELFIKDDGVSAPAYGGNKIRKLELLLGLAKAQRRRRVITFGYAGSNHATATAHAAASLGMTSVSMLLPQANEPYVGRNLLVSQAAGASFHLHGSVPRLAASTVGRWLASTVADRRPPAVIPPGGSSPLGTVGYVAAAFELAEQVEAGLAPWPAAIYVAAGSLGTAVGLALGLEALGAPTRVVAVRVAATEYVNARLAARLATRTANLLDRHEVSVRYPFASSERLEIREGFFGAGYAIATDQGREAARTVADTAGLSVDPSYTAKTLAALIADARGGRLAGPTVFWNTYNQRDTAPLTAAADAAALPPGLRAYVDDRV